jgi:hypothetical protein
LRDHSRSRGWERGLGAGLSLAMVRDEPFADNQGGPIMNKTLIRSYAIASEGDLVVKKFDAGKVTDLSKDYEDVSRERKNMREDVYLDVFRYDDGDLAWSGSSNGHEIENAFSYKLLLDVFTRDLTASGPRAF